MRYVEWFHGIQLDEDDWFTVNHFLDTRCVRVQVGLTDGSILICPTSTETNNTVKVRIPHGWNSWPVIVVVDSAS